MTRQQIAEFVGRALPHVFGIGGILLIIAGVWGLAGWQWAAIAAGLLPAAFYVYGEIRVLQRPKSSTIEET